MADAIFNHAANLESPAWTAVAVTPNDSADLARVATRGLYIGGDGNLSVVMSGGGTVAFTGLLGGTILPVRVDRVRSTGTTAQDIVALY
jgi:hypothetical protein